MRNIWTATCSGDLAAAFFGLTAGAIGIVFVLHYAGGFILPDARAEAESPDYRLTITAKRLPVECRDGGVMRGATYCDRFYDRGVTEQMQRLAP